MTADVLPVSAAKQVEVPQTVSAAATVWATVSILDGLNSNGHRSAAQAHVDVSLRELDLAKPELYDHIVDVVERNGWASVDGASDIPDD